MHEKADRTGTQGRPGPGIAQCRRLQNPENLDSKSGDALVNLKSEDVRKILELIDALDYDEVKLEMEDLKLEIRKTYIPPVEHSGHHQQYSEPRNASIPQIRTTQPVSAAEQATNAVVAPREVPEGCIAIRAPSVGTFYRAPSPEQPPFVEVGARVETVDTVGLVEVMKLFNSVHPDASGTILEIWVANGELVEFGQVLMTLKPDESSID